MSLHPNRSQWLVIWGVAGLVLGLWLAGAPWQLAMASDRSTHVAYEAVQGGIAKPTRRQLEFEVMALASDQKANRARRERIQAARDEVRMRSIIALLVLGGLLVGQLAGRRNGSPIE